MDEVSVVLILVGLAAALSPSGSYGPPLPPPPCLEYGGCRHHHHAPFVPAPPGKTPGCAKHGQTFCEKPDKYPINHKAKEDPCYPEPQLFQPQLKQIMDKARTNFTKEFRHLIRYLVEHWVYDYRTLLSDESRNEFPKQNKTPKPTYGPPPPPYGQPLHPPLPFYPPPPPPPLAGNSINLTQPEGYPDRRYPLSSLPYLGADPSLVYSSLLQPDVTPYDPSHWWRRYTRSDGSKSRSRRQLPGQDTQLCPTRAQFVSPRAALNAQGNWMYIVNLEPDQNRFTQQVRAENCISDQCDGLCSLPNGYRSRCQQQYVQKRLVALEGSGNQLYTDTFWLPHCCICQITPTNNG